MPRIKALVADDSPTVRALLVGILTSYGRIEVVAEAKDGKEAVELARRLRPNVITIDIHMPLMDGLEATRHIMTETPTPIVVISGSALALDVTRTMEALAAGALTVLKKPAGPLDPGFTAQSRKIAETVLAMADVKVVRRNRSLQAAFAPEARMPELVRGSAKRIVSIIASTGGPQALSSILAGLPAAFPVPILVVQHMADGFVEGFAEWLGRSCAFSVSVATDGMPLGPGQVVIAPSDRHLGVTAGGRAKLSGAEPVGGFRPSGTYLLGSVAEVYGEGALAVILTGMGRDGADGAREVRQRGGFVIAQDEASSVVFGMPGAVIETSSADEVASLDAIADYLVLLTQNRTALR